MTDPGLSYALRATGRRSRIDPIRGPNNTLTAPDPRYGFAVNARHRQSGAGKSGITGSITSTQSHGDHLLLSNIETNADAIEDATNTIDIERAEPVLFSVLIAVSTCGGFRF